MGYESFTLAELQADLAEARASLSRSRTATGYAIGTRQLTRAGIRELREEIKELSAEIAARTDQSGGMGLIEFGAPQ